MTGIQNVFSSIRSARLFRGKSDESVSEWTRTDWAFAATVSLFGLVVYLHGLGSYPLRPWDEGMYANVARHMVRDGFWLVPHMTHGAGLRSSSFGPFMEKPPLYLWLEGVSMSIFGVTAFAARLPSALAAVTTGTVVYYAGRRLYDSRTGLFAGLVFLTTPFLYLGFNNARSASLDPLLVLGGTVFVLGVWFAGRYGRPYWLYVGALGASVAVLTKGFAAGIFLLIVIPLVVKHWRTYLTSHSAVAAAVALALMLPWPIYMYLKLGDPFVDQIFWEQVASRVGRADHTTFALLPFSNFPYTTYLAASPTYFQPWTTFLAGFTAVIGVRAWRNRSLSFSNFFLLWWIVAPLAFFTSTGGLGSYIMPIYVPAGLLVGNGLAQASRGDRTQIAVVVVSAILGAGLLVAFHVVKRPVRDLPMRVVAVLAVAAGVVLLARRGSRELELRSAGKLAVASGLVAAVFVGGTMAVPAIPGGVTYEKAYDQYRVGQVAKQAGAEDVYVENSLGSAVHTFAFYSEAKLTSGPLSDVRVPPNGRRYVLVSKANVSRLSRRYDVTILANESGTYVEGAFWNVSLVYVESTDRGNSTAERPVVDTDAVRSTTTRANRASLRGGRP